MERLTVPDGDYCELICGLKKHCKRLNEGKPCKNSIFYAKLQEYENTGREPEEINSLHNAEV